MCNDEGKDCGQQNRDPNVGHARFILQHKTPILNRIPFTFRHTRIQFATLAIKTYKPDDSSAK